MKSDTPRTDAAVLDEHDPVTAVAETCRQLERELASANTRITKLNEALSLVFPRCEHLHHAKKHQHCATAHCPVEMLFEELMK